MKSHGKIDDLSSKRSRISPTWNVTRDGAFTRLTTYLWTKPVCSRTTRIHWQLNMDKEKHILCLWLFMFTLWYMNIDSKNKWTENQSLVDTMQSSKPHLAGLSCIFTGRQNNRGKQSNSQWVETGDVSLPWLFGLEFAPCFWGLDSPILFPWYFMLSKNNPIQGEGQWCEGRSRSKHSPSYEHQLSVNGVSTYKFPIYSSQRPLKIPLSQLIVAVFSRFPYYGLS